MTYDRNWTIIIFVIYVAIILIDRRHSGVLPVLLKDTRPKGFIYHICQWYRNIWGWFSQENEVHTQYIIIRLIRKRSQICFNIFLRHILETKTINTFWAFPEKIVMKILKFWVHFLANIAKMVIEIIRRNITSNKRVFIFYQVPVVLFPTTFLGVISAKCMNIIEIGIFAVLENIRNFIP